MAGNIKGIIVEIGGDTSGLQNALKKVNSTTSSLSKELRGINSLLKLDPKNTELVSQKQTVLKQNIEQTSKKLEELKKAQEAADAIIAEGGEISEENYRNLQREIINTENKLKQLKVEASKWTTAGRSIEEFGNKVTNISNKIDKMGTTLTTRLTIPIAGIAVGLVNSAREFETAFTGVEKTVDGTATQMEHLKQGIKDMSEEIPASTTEISAVAEAAGQLGIQTDNVLAFTKTMINMGNATNLSADEAATTLARFANVTKMSQSDFDKLGSVIVALGNNFATTEAEISEMGMNLASAGTQVGMSQAQIMALATALSSVGLEAQAGGTAFSKVMVNMQLAVEKGGKDLKNFATVAGMSTKQFQKAFKEDATSAIMQFVDGLSKSGERGQSAIRILDDMGITETRLRDALLRSANASGVMGKAIELGNKAWEENTALTNEANKRYQTLDSRMEMTKNKIKNLATNTGSKLTPTFIKLLDKIDGLIDRFNNLNEEEVNNIIKTAAMVAAIGPAIKIFATLGKGVGTATKGIGLFSQAVAVAKNNATSSVTSINNLAKVITVLSTPTGFAVAGFGALTATLIALKAAQLDEMFSMNGLREQVEKQKNTWDELTKARNENLSSSMAQIDICESLKDELGKITDENGKVKEGYEQRAQVILTTLNKALGTEYELNGNIISQYKDLKDNIDNIIAAKKAEAVLNAYQEEYGVAIKEQADATQNLISLKKQLAEAQEKVANGNYLEQAEAKMLINAIGKDIKTQTEQIGKYGKTIQDYENLQKASVEGSAEAITNAIEQIGVSYENTKIQANESVIEQINAQQQYVNSIKESLEVAKKTEDVYQTDILKKQLETNQQKLDNLKNSLTQQTNTIQELTPEQIEAWKQIGQNSVTEYALLLSQIPEETAKKIEESTGIVVSDNQLSNAFELKASNSTGLFKNNLQLSNAAKTEIQNTSIAIEGDNSVGIASQKLAQEADSNFNNNVDGKKWGGDLVGNIASGLWNISTIGIISNAASSVAGLISDYLHHTTPEKGPLKDDDKWMADFIDNIAGGILKNKYKVINSVEKMAQDMQEQLNIPLIKDFNKFQGSINNQIIDSTKTVFTTPQIVFNVQELDEAKLQQCFNFINKKFGSAY